jgi:hypothetical protein
MGPLNTAQATREDLIARIETLESKVTELSINEIGLEDIIRALKREMLVNPTELQRVKVLHEDTSHRAIYWQRKAEELKGEDR